MIRNNSAKLAGVFLLTFLFSTMAGKAQMPPPDPFYKLTTWSFNDTNWWSDRGYPPLSFTNLNNPTGFDGNALQVDTNNPAWLQYSIFENDGTTNLTFNEGSIELWVLPDWNSGQGPGDWGRLIDVGAYGTNSPSSWWSLYFDPSGTNLWFSSETDGAFTNYLSFPISWDTNTWHFVALTYTRTRSRLYLDGQLATNGLGVIYRPDAGTVSNGFSVGSDSTGWEQSRALIDDLATYNYPIGAGAVSNDYVAGEQLMNGGLLATGGGFGMDDSSGTGDTATGPGTNLWIGWITVSNGIAAFWVTNTQSDVLYELQGCTNLVQTTNWISFGFFNGSEISNAIALTLSASKQGNLFLRIRSWEDSTGTGIPDWWWLTYFQQITNVDGYAQDPAGDGYTDLQKYQMGLSPTNYYNTNPISGFFGCLDLGGTNAVLEWSPAPGPVINYQIQRGIMDTNGNYAFSQIALLSSNSIFFKDTGAITNDNAQNNIYLLNAVYADGGVSITNSWTVSDYIDSGNGGPPAGAPLPGNSYAYAVANGTNVSISWTPPVGGAPTNYLVFRGVYDSTNGGYDYSQIGSLGTNTTIFNDVGVIQTPDDWNDTYEIVAVYNGGGVSQPATVGISTNPPPPTDVMAAVDVTGTNVVVTWNPPQGVTVTNYVIERGFYDTNTQSYNYTQIGNVGAGTNSFEDVGVISNAFAFQISYQVQAVLPGVGPSDFEASFISNEPNTPPTENIRLTADLVRNGTGRWQIMFSGYSTDIAQTIKLTWTNSTGDTLLDDISTTNIVDGVYPIPDEEVVSLLGYSLSVQMFGTDGKAGQISQAGTISSDAPYFVDGREHMKQNLNFLIRAASLYQPFGFSTDNRLNDSATNFEEFSYLHHDSAFNGYSYAVVTLDNLWPFAENYVFSNYLLEMNGSDEYYPTNNQFGQFSFEPDFATNIPAPAVLDQADPYWILQPSFQPYPPPYNNTANWGVTTSDFIDINESRAVTASLPSGLYNLFGLPELTGNVVGNYWTPSSFAYCHLLAPGSSVTITNIFSVDWGVGAYASQCPMPTLTLASYYFAPLNNPNLNSTNLPSVSQQPFPLPIDDGFNVTNQTPSFIVGTIGQPMIVAGWAKYAIENGGTPTGKYAYLGQYFGTNAPLLDGSGNATTNSAGVLSPYGEFFPLQAGIAQLTTMPDIDNGQRGTNYVRIISMNVDANHDGTMDLSYSSPDFVSTSKPFRFWVNDDVDSGDYGGEGIPGQPSQVADASCVYIQQTDVNVPVPQFDHVIVDAYRIHGRRDLVDYFPVYLNIGSLFQSNALSAGINLNDPDYQFALSQADGVLRFVYTDLTPTNYINFLRDTNVSGKLTDPPVEVFPIVPQGTCLDISFIKNIATNNGGILLVEAATNTTQPLVLTIYHGTNQIAQTSLPLSISGVEQMFRSKTMLLHSDQRAVPDRLTDASVPNEPDTTGVNFIFVHGYNVNPNQARGWNADYYKRLYWSGSHAKYYGVTWTASDSQVAGRVSINLQTNIVHAFATAPLLNTFLNSLSGTNVVAAHSLGNMLVLSTLNDYTNRNINTYFMIDAAVAIEAIDPGAPLNPDMYPTAWTNYESRLWAAEWHDLFPSNDARSQLTWSGRLANLQNASVYNFYSSGEEVLRDYPTDPPTDFTGIAESQLVAAWEGDSGVDAWAFQEKLKGLMPGNGFLSSNHGGWGMNRAYETNVIGLDVSYWNPMSPTIAAELTDTQLKTNAFFNFSSLPTLNSQFTNDLALESSGGSGYAKANQNRILSDAIPCLTLPLGANHDTNIDVEFGETRNFDMQANYENGWPLGRGLGHYPVGTTFGEWHHSDNRAIAYTFTYKLFDQMVVFGNLK